MALNTSPTEDYRQLFSRGPYLAALRRWPAFSELTEEDAISVTAQAARFAQGVLAPLNAAADLHGSRLVDHGVRTPLGIRAAYEQYRQAGWHGLDAAEEDGGQGLPQVLRLAVSEMMIGACMAFAMLPLQQRAAARVLKAHADVRLREQFLRALVAGEIGATIAMTEPEAGSDVGRASTRAQARGDGSHALWGLKCFISYADHDLTEQIVHLVLARLPGAAAGAAGLSLFLVPKWLEQDGARVRNAATVTAVEHKMGLRASPTCALALDGATGYLIGEAGRGMRAIFTMVNTMRLEVAMQGVAIAHAATQQALAYAATRRQGGPAGAPAQALDQHPDVRRMLATMQMRVHGARQLVLQTALLLDQAAAAPCAEERDGARLLAEWLLPLCKVLGSETGFDVANLAVQVHGRNGYVADYGVEQHVRDIRVAAIFEGANGIQAIDLVTRKLAEGDGARYQAFVRWVRAASARAAQAGHAATLVAALAHALAQLERLTVQIQEQHPTDRQRPLWAATPYLQLAGLVALGAGWAHAIAADYPWARAGAALFASTLPSQADLHAAQAAGMADVLCTLAPDALAA